MTKHTDHEYDDFEFDGGEGHTTQVPLEESDNTPAYGALNYGLAGYRIRDRLSGMWSTPKRKAITASGGLIGVASIVTGALMLSGDGESNEADRQIEVSGLPPYTESTVESTIVTEPELTIAQDLTPTTIEAVIPTAPAPSLASESLPEIALPEITVDIDNPVTTLTVPPPSSIVSTTIEIASTTLPQTSSTTEVPTTTLAPTTNLSPTTTTEVPTTTLAPTSTTEAPTTTAATTESPIIASEINLPDTTEPAVETTEPAVETTAPIIMAEPETTAPLTINTSPEIIVPQISSELCNETGFNIPPNVGSHWLRLQAELCDISLSDLVANNEGLNPNNLIAGEWVDLVITTPTPTVTTAPATLPASTIGSTAPEVVTTTTEPVVATSEPTTTTAAPTTTSTTTTTTTTQPAPTTTEAAPPITEAPSSYTVQAGDTLSEIAQRNGLSVDALLAANPSIVDPNTILPGQVLNLRGVAASPNTTAPNNTATPASTLPQNSSPNTSAPATTAPQTTQPTVSSTVARAGERLEYNRIYGWEDCTQITVKQGMNAGKIAIGCHITIEQLAAANPHITPDISNIHPGDVLNIPTPIE